MPAANNPCKSSQADFVAAVGFVARLILTVSPSYSRTPAEEDMLEMWLSSLLGTVSSFFLAPTNFNSDCGVELLVLVASSSV